DVLKEYIKIAFADITNYVTFGQREVELEPLEKTSVDEEGNEVTEFITETRMMNYIDLAESDMVDGSIITEVKQGRDGISIKLADKMKALDKLAQYFDLVPDNFKRQIEEERHKMQMEVQKVNVEKAKAEVEKLTGNGNDGPIEIVVTRK
ncbi:terminase small subunit, partial [Bacillus cereus]